MQLAAEIIGTYVAVRWWLLRRSLPETLAAARRDAEPPCAHGSEVPLEAALRLGRAVQRTLGALPLDSRCLIRSLVLTRILARRGAHSSLIIGVSASPRFSAHAWVEYAGVPLLPSGSGFHRLTEL